jgi:hypothetical protein
MIIIFEGNWIIKKAWKELKMVFILILSLQALLPVCLDQNIQGIPSFVGRVK